MRTYTCTQHVHSGCMLQANYADMEALSPIGAKDKGAKLVCAWACDVAGVLVLNRMAAAAFALVAGMFKSCISSFQLQAV